MKRTPLTRKPRTNVMSRESHDEVLRLDYGQCVAQALDPDAGPCRDKWREPILSWQTRLLTIEHVGAAPGKGDSRDDVSLCVSLCPGHGVQSWELSHKDLMRAYLRHREPGRSIVEAARLARQEMTDG